MHKVSIRWFNQLFAKHPGKFLAIFEGKVVAVVDSIQELAGYVHDGTTVLRVPRERHHHLDIGDGSGEDLEQALRKPAPRSKRKLAEIVADADPDAASADLDRRAVHPDDIGREIAALLAPPEATITIGEDGVPVATIGESE